MKIAQVAPLFERVPPVAYGGTERVISHLTEELIGQGHDVTLFASGDSITKANLVSVIDYAMRPQQSHAWMAFHAMELDLVCQYAQNFDVIHFHTDYLHFPITKYLGTPHVTTLHGRLDLPELPPLYKHFNNVPLVSISNSQRTPLPWANWCGTVYHGMPPLCDSIESTPDDYFVFIGRVSPEKRVDRAIDIARQCGIPLYIAAKVDIADEAYFNEYIRPLMDTPLVTFLGEINDVEKSKLLKHAKALLFPIDWPEPFGLVMIEAFSCGTPVIAYRNGSVPEIMEHGVTGFVVTNQDEAIEAARNIESIDRTGCRNSFERRFTTTLMANNYVHVYQKLLANAGTRKES
ncbi:MAG TPA: glycosyltransferase family 4 protein [Burkholderiaceae bacterium]|jgi:glycosyltransferase involved in cell wall biosynthesis